MYDSPMAICILSLTVTIRFILPFPSAGGAALSDSDADQRALGGFSAGGTLPSCQVPHPGCLEVR